MTAYGSACESQFITATSSGCYSFAFSERVKNGDSLKHLSCDMAERQV